MALLELRGASKHYPGVRALSGVDVDVEAGEVHALLGENGAGKSTLMKIAAGSVVPDTGRMEVGGTDVAFGSPQLARDRGIGIVYQELSLVPTLSVAENVWLGRWPTKRPFGTVDWERLNGEASEWLTRVGLGDQDPRQLVQPLGTATRQLIEIAKALSGDARVLLLDEPTSALSEPEAERLFSLIEALTAAGVGIVYVSHRLGEVVRIAHRVTVLRNGEHVGTYPIARVSETDLAVMMVGREVSGADGAKASGQSGDKHVLLRARGFARPPRVRPIDLDVHEGEIIGVFGLAGSGRAELGRLLFGLDPATEGDVAVDGHAVALSSPARASALGIGYVAAERSQGVIPQLSAVQNLTLGALDRVTNGPLLNRRAEREIGTRLIEDLDIKLRSPDQPAQTLSGGNQQKVVLGRWLASQSRLLILDDPTRGIDVGAKEEVFRIVRRLVAEGVAILYLTSEIREAKALADRILVMAGGAVVDTLEADAPQDRIMAAAGGARG